MARGVRASLCSYKKITIAVCLFNLFIALLILRSLYSARVNRNSFPERKKYTEEQIERIKESIRIREESEPSELVKAVKKLKKERILQLEKKVNLSQSVKQKLTDEILERLGSLKEGSNATDEIEAVELWRIEKLNDLKIESEGKNSSSFVNSTKEAKILKQAVESKSNWLNLMEEIGLWLPPNISNPQHDDKPPNEPEEEEIIAGPPLRAECHTEVHTDYGGAAVRWGLTHHKESAADCCQACIDQSNNAKPGEMKCNIWVYCPSEFGCYSPDIYEHKHQECWLKMAEKPKVTFKGKYSEAYRDSHPRAPVVVPWMSGVITTS